MKHPHRSTIERLVSLVALTPVACGSRTPLYDFAQSTASVASIVLGQQYTCVVVLGSVKCWGHNARGALGLGDTLPRGFDPAALRTLAPVDLGIGGAVKLVAATDDHTCALFENNW